MMLIQPPEQYSSGFVPTFSPLIPSHGHGLPPLTPHTVVTNQIIGGGDHQHQQGSTLNAPSLMQQHLSAGSQATFNNNIMQHMYTPAATVAVVPEEKVLVPDLALHKEAILELTGRSRVDLISRINNALFVPSEDSEQGHPVRTVFLSTAEEAELTRHSPPDRFDLFSTRGSSLSELRCSSLNDCSEPWPRNASLRANDPPQTFCLSGFPKAWRGIGESEAGPSPPHVWGHLLFHYDATNEPVPTSLFLDQLIPFGSKDYERGQALVTILFGRSLGSVMLDRDDSSDLHMRNILSSLLGYGVIAQLRDRSYNNCVYYLVPHYDVDICSIGAQIYCQKLKLPLESFCRPTTVVTGRDLILNKRLALVLDMSTIVVAEQVAGKKKKVTTMKEGLTDEEAEGLVDLSHQFDIYLYCASLEHSKMAYNCLQSFLGKGGEARFMHICSYWSKDIEDVTWNLPKEMTVIVTDKRKEWLPQMNVLSMAQGNFFVNKSRFISIQSQYEKLVKGIVRYLLEWRGTLDIHARAQVPAIESLIRDAESKLVDT
jgi:hypothetical protein